MIFILVRDAARQDVPAVVTEVTDVTARRQCGMLLQDVTAGCHCKMSQGCVGAGCQSRIFVTARCHCRMSWPGSLRRMPKQDAAAGRHNKMSREDVTARCHDRISRQDVTAKCHGKFGARLRQDVCGTLEARLRQVKRTFGARLRS